MNIKSMQNIYEYMKHVPIVGLLAIMFYVLAIGALLLPSFQRRALIMLLPPLPGGGGIHLSSLDAIRGLAALWVVTFHSWQWWQIGVCPQLTAPLLIRAGDKAVPVFVALSGFLIFKTLSGITSIDDLRRYALNRFLRIYPVYAATVLFIALTGFSVYFHPAGQGMIAELLMLRAIGFENFANPPTWSLYVEVLFYVIAPMFVIVAGKRSTVTMLMAFATLSIVDKVGVRELQLWKYFFLGGLAWKSFIALSRKCPELAAQALFWMGSIILAYDISQYEGANARTAWLSTAIYLVLLGSSLSQQISKLFAAPPWRLLAAVSYSLYMWHAFIVVAGSPMGFDGKGGLTFSTLGESAVAPLLPARVFIILPAALLVASVSYVLLERPALKWRWKGGARNSQGNAAETLRRLVDSERA